MDLLDEIATDIKNEKQFKILLKILPFIAIATIIFVGVISYQTWSNSKHLQHNTAMGDLLHNAVALNTAADNHQIVDESYDYIMRTAKNHINDLAALNKAVMQNKSRAASFKLLEDIINTESYSYIIKDYAKILWLSLAIDMTNNQDSIKFLQFIDYFTIEKQLFFSSAQLIKALNLIKHNDNNAAKPILERVITSKYATITNKDYAHKILANLQRLDYNN